jgi:hypothetical protein
MSSRLFLSNPNPNPNWQVYIPEPMVLPEEKSPEAPNEESKDETSDEPPLDDCLFWTVLIGSVVDNLGNAGLGIALNTVLIAAYAPSASMYGVIMMFLIVTIFMGVAIGQKVMASFGSSPPHVPSWG